MDESQIELAVQAGWVAFLVLVGWIAGRAAELRHLRTLTYRRRRLRHIGVTDLKLLPGVIVGPRPPALVTGEAVIGSDYYKTFAAGLRRIVGGEVRSYVTLVDRARQEALLRMLADAERQGYDAVGNVRFESADISGAGQSRKALPLAAVLASGTAYCTRPREEPLG